MQPQWLTLPLVFIAGGIGALARFTLDSAVKTAQQKNSLRRKKTSPIFPLGTILVNSCAGILAGLVQGILTAAQPEQTLLIQVLQAGFLGGFSTFSTASMDTVRLLAGGRLLAAINYQLATFTAAFLPYTLILTVTN